MGSPVLESTVRMVVCADVPKGRQSMVNKTKLNIFMNARECARWAGGLQ